MSTPIQVQASASASQTSLSPATHTCSIIHERRGRSSAFGRRECYSCDTETRGSPELSCFDHFRCFSILFTAMSPTVSVHCHAFPFCFEGILLLYRRLSWRPPVSASLALLPGLLIPPVCHSLCHLTGSSDQLSSPLLSEDKDSTCNLWALHSEGHWTPTHSRCGPTSLNSGASVANYGAVTQSVVGQGTEWRGCASPERFFRLGSQAPPHPLFWLPLRGSFAL